LTQRNSTIVRWYSLVPVRAERLFSEPPHGLLGKIPVLEAAPREGNPTLAGKTGNGNDQLNEAVVELRGDPADGRTLPEVGDDTAHDRLPVSRILAIASGLRSPSVSINGFFADRMLERHGRLSFEARALAEVEERRHRVEEPTSTGGKWGVDRSSHHADEHRPFAGREGSNRGQVRWQVLAE
jgi:hypothetical protein